jgi:hypothetical protein
MYSTCLFCHSDLGANEAIEHFQVGRRLAFDAAKGRLWVVCRKCERWNLTPVEERWEAVEECERGYRGTKLRVSTEHIGLARLPEGTELVRIGAPQRPEFAAWRYGDQFGRRRKKQIAIAGAAFVGGALVLPLGGALIPASLGMGATGMWQVAHFAQLALHRNKIVARIESDDGEQMIVRRHHVRGAMLLRRDYDHTWGLRLKHSTAKSWWQYDSESATAVVHGEQALRLVGQILPAMNSRGASKKKLKKAIALIERQSDADSFFRAAAKVADLPSWDYPRHSDARGTLEHLPSEVLLALEMLSHEESERRAMEGELQVLEEAWREAEEIAGISDNLFLPTEISTRLAEMKRDGA